MYRVLLLLILVSCSPKHDKTSTNDTQGIEDTETSKPLTNQKNVELKIQEYLMRNLDNPKSYESVSFDTLTLMTEEYSVWAELAPNSKYFMHHQYRSTNRYNALILTESIFFLDSNLTILRQMRL